MYISKKQSIAFAIGGIALFFLIGILSIKSRTAPVKSTSNELPSKVNDEASETVTSPVETVEPTPEPKPTAPDDSRIKLFDFERSQTKNGKKVWEVKAKQGKYFPETNSAVIEDGIFFMYEEDGSVTQIVAGHAELYLSEASLSKAELSQGVIVNFDKRELKLTTNEATYETESGRVVAEGYVEIETPRMKITGEGLEAFIKEEEFSLAKKVTSLLKPTKG